MEAPTHKLQDTNKSQITNNKIFDLEARTKQFSLLVISLIKALPKNPINFRLADQLLRSSTSIGANYIEANDALGKKDFLLRTKIARKETKETQYWLNLLLEVNSDYKDKLILCIKEAQELRNILSKIIINTK